MQKYEKLLVRTGAPACAAVRGFLRHHGYERVEEINGPGEYRWLGDRLEVFIAEGRGPTQIDFWEEQIEKIVVGEQTPATCWLLDNRLLTEDGAVERGGYIVHPHHGIGRYLGRFSRRFHRETKSFLLLEYAGSDHLYFPREREEELMPYFGRRQPRLTRLHSAVWQRTKRRIERELESVARELLVTAAQRAVQRRAPWPTAADWQAHLDNTFAHTLTVDQRRAVQEIEHDLTAATQPMDRLLTGDVGYGKTEVAIRAATKVLAGGGQVAVLAPTTVLAEQHYHVWTQRLRGLPVRLIKIARGSALTAEQRRELAAGQIDLVIGTHKLLTAALQWRQLGLVVVDEEQRFGVVQKEYFKRQRATVDVLSVAATPIPRTLYLGLTGLRALSAIRTPPGERRGVETRVRPWRASSLAAAVTREIARRGQIYLVHNRIETLPAAVARLRRALAGRYRLVRAGESGNRPSSKSSLPAVRFAVAHGRLDSSQLTKIMHQFFIGELDLLVTTAIVENGLDNPRANTLIVERAEQFGLADLYQLRGRVGRRNKKGYALLLVGDSERPRRTPLSAEAVERLQILADTERLGSGWNLALKDLELRGAGSLIGRQQHGNLEAIGLVLYSRLLRRVVERLQAASLNRHSLSATVRVWTSGD